MRIPGLASLFALAVLAGVPVAASGALVPVKQPDVCFECHNDLTAGPGAEHLHTAFAEGNCAGCHNPHASKHANLLDQDRRELCLRCHDDMRSAGLAAAPHVPVANGDCLLCHDPHASAQEKQLIQPLAELCGSCHASVAEWDTRSRVHDPVAEAACLTCHAAHGSEISGLLVGEIPGLCYECHDEDAAFDQAHGGRSLGAANCVACHDPHASNVKGLLRAHSHKPFADNDCGKCHGDLASQGSFAVSGTTQEMCLKCHKAVAVYEGKANHHNLDSEQSCLACHNPHASNEEALLLRDQAQLCLGCHFNDKPDKSAWVTHPGKECTECHVPHGNDDAQLLVRRDIMLCGRCHEEAHEVTHPVGPEVIDPRTEESVTCLSCHQMHGARFAQYLPLNPDMELCIQCHQR